MRRKFSLLLAMIMLLGIFTGCAPEEQGETSDPVETTTQAPVPDVLKLELSATEKKALIDAYYVWLSTQQPGGYEELKWADFSDTAETGCTYSGYRYYGTFGDCIVWFRGNVHGTPNEVEIAGAVFAHPYYADYFVYNNQTLYTLQEAYDRGMISKEDVATVAGYHADYNAEAAKNPNAVVMDLTLTPEKEREIKQAYYDSLKDKDGYSVEKMPLRVVTNYEGVYALWIYDKNEGSGLGWVTTVSLKKPGAQEFFAGYVDSYEFTCIDNTFIKIYANNRFYELVEAWEEGVLSAAHVELLLEGNRYMNRYGYPKDWRS